jgi:hypothetical protein
MITAIVLCVISFLFIAIIVIAWFNTPNCKRGGKHHNFFFPFGDFYRQPTGDKRLPGDRVSQDWQRPDEEVGYRFERHCLDCSYKEYKRYSDVGQYTHTWEPK